MPRHGRTGEAFVTSRWAVLALPLWLCYRPLVWLRNACFDLRLRQPRRLDAPTISVGNIVAGGTGKTPLVAWLVDSLRARGRNPAVLMRGYKATGDGRNDEAAMLAAPVFCHPKRFLAGREARAAGHDALVLDDGFQHRQLARDLDLVCIDASRPFGQPGVTRGRTLPLGLLRESIPALKRAHAAIITRCDQLDDAGLERLTAILQRHVNTVLRCRHAPKMLRAIGRDEQREPASLAGQRVILLSAIGNPDAFTRTLSDLGAEVVRH